MNKRGRGRRASQQPSRSLRRATLRSPYRHSSYIPQKNTARVTRKKHPVTLAYETAMRGQTEPSLSLSGSPSQMPIRRVSAERSPAPSDHPDHRQSSQMMPVSSYLQASTAPSHQHVVTLPRQESPTAQSPTLDTMPGVAAASIPSVDVHETLRDGTEERISAPVVAFTQAARPRLTVRREIPTSDSGQLLRRAKGTIVMIALILITFTVIIPRIIDVFDTDVPLSFIDSIVDETPTEDEYGRPIAAAPVPTPLPTSFGLTNGFLPHQSGSRETPASLGERIVVGPLALTVTNVERGERASRAAYKMPPAGWEYILVDLQVENPHNEVVDFNPVLLNNTDEAIYPEPDVKGSDLRVEAKPDHAGTRRGKVLFLVEEGTMPTLMLTAYDPQYPVVFYAIP